MLGLGIASRAAVPASCMQVLDNDDKPYLYVRSRNCVKRVAVRASCTQVLENADVAYLFIGPGIASRSADPAERKQVLRQ
jgi:hypothetical protein